MMQAELQRILLEKDWKMLREKAAEDREIVRQLMSRIYVKEGLLFWRAIEGLGIAAQTIEHIQPGYAVELVRRYFWSLNEESGGTAWNASEAIGSIMAHCPEECGHFNWMYSKLLEDQSLNEGTLWGLAQLACVKPELVLPLAEVVLPFLNSENPELSGRAALIQALLQDWKEVSGTVIEGHKEAELELYFNNQIQVYSIEELLHPQRVSYWQEYVEIDNWTWSLTVASNAEGIIWVALGEPDAEKDQLEDYLNRWYPHSFLLKRRTPTEKVLEQVKEYLRGQRQAFTLPLQPRGTVFQLRVWEELRKIPYGETCSYGEIAQKIGNPKGQRAVGMANHNNPIAVIVPCHRVVGKSGALTGYAGGIHLKERLLEIENRNKERSK